MPTRRQTLALGAVLIAAPTLAVAQTANRPNPMPEPLRKAMTDLAVTASATMPDALRCSMISKKPGLVGFGPAMAMDG